MCWICLSSSTQGSEKERLKVGGDLAVTLAVTTGGEEQWIEDEKGGYWEHIGGTPVPDLDTSLIDVWVHAREKVTEEILSLPMYPELTTEEIDYVCDCVRDFCELNPEESKFKVRR